MKKRTLLISIHPEYVEKILDGTKQVEFRKSRPRVDTGATAIIYVTSPISSIMYSFKIKKIVEMPPHKLWQRVGGIAGISKEQYEKYYQDKKKAVGIYFEDVASMPNPLRLDLLKTTISGFSPPQSYCYLDRFQIDSLAHAHPCLTRLLGYSRLRPTVGDRPVCQASR